MADLLIGRYGFYGFLSGQCDGNGFPGTSILMPGE
jgi:hypothetical protein